MYDVNLDLVLGRMGTGKSSYMAMCARDMWIANNGECNIFGGYNLRIPGYHYITTKDLMMMLSNNRLYEDILNNGMLQLDEAYLYMGRRVTQSLQNRFYSSCLLYTSPSPRD